MNSAEALEKAIEWAEKAERAGSWEGTRTWSHLSRTYVQIASSLVSQELTEELRQLDRGEFDDDE